MKRRWVRGVLAALTVVWFATPSAAQDWLIIGGYSIRARHR